MIRFYNQFKDFIQLLILIIISAVLVYYIPVEFNRILFLLFLVPIWKSKKDYFWFAFLLLLLDYPGGLFAGGGLLNPYRLPLYTIAPQVSFSFDEVIILLFLFKGISKKRWRQYKEFVYRKQFGYLGMYLVLLFVVSLLLGTSFNSMRVAFKTLIVLSLYVSSIFIFAREEEVIGFFKALFPFAFVAVLLQLYGLIYHQQIVALVEPGTKLAQGLLDVGKEMRPIELATVMLFCFFGSLLFLDNRRQVFSNKYLILINITSFIVIFMTATRSWILGLAIMYFFYFIFNLKKIKRNILNITIGSSFVLLIMLLVPLVKTQADQSLTRLRSFELIYKGDMTAGGTLSRLTERGPQVMKGFNESSILFGAGFSDLFYEYGDGHVGFQNILLHSGIIGFILLLSFALKLFLKPYNISNKIAIRSDLKSILLNLPLLIPAVLFINSGTQFWGYGVSQTSRVMLLAFYIGISSLYINTYKHIVLNKLKLKKQ